MSSPIDLAGLETLSVDQLRSSWAALFGKEPASRVSRELLLRAIAYRLQEQATGGLSPKEVRELDRIGAVNRDGSGTSQKSPIILRPGNRLVREWQGVVHEVIVLDNQFLWKGERYRSLSKIARRITGTHWSGPRFFGLNATKQGSRSGASEPAHG